MDLDGRVVPVADVNPAQREEMFALMDRYYDGMVRETFDNDLDEKDWVIEIRESNSQILRGFSTQVVLNLEIDRRSVRGLFSGDTIVDQQCWHQNPLAGLWGHLALSLADEEPRQELYWFLICKGYKTYRFLPTFFREYFPRPERDTPRWARHLVDAFGYHKFHESYDSRSGIIRASTSGCRLKPGVAAVTPERWRNADIQYFCEHNPGHTQGDELCCVAPLSRENFTPLAWRVIEAARPLIRDSRPLPCRASLALPT